jgi:hypothetical protein
VAKNPFHPTFGVSPPLLVGRDSLIEAVAEAIDDGPGAPARATLYTGPRGSGKTVLLNAVEDQARTQGWAVISETADPGFIERMTHQHLPLLLRGLDPAAVRKRLSGLNIPLGPLGSAGADWNTVETHVVQAGLRNQIELLTDLLAADGLGLLITLDEVHHQQIDELRQFGTTVQHAFREERELMFVGAGLSSAVSDLLNDKVLTFLRRADRHHLGSVSRAEVARAIREPVGGTGRTIGDEALTVMVEGTGGYPFLIQLVGHRTWRLHPGTTEIIVNDAREGVAEALRRLGSLVYEPALADASDVDKTFLLAMAKDDGPSKMADIQQRLGVNESYASQYRLRLIAAELIEPKKRGYVDFALPYLREYLRDEAVAEI